MCVHVLVSLSKERQTTFSFRKSSNVLLQELIATAYQCLQTYSNPCCIILVLLLEKINICCGVYDLRSHTVSGFMTGCIKEVTSF